MTQMLHIWQVYFNFYFFSNLPHGVGWDSAKRLTYLTQTFWILKHSFLEVWVDSSLGIAELCAIVESFVDIGNFNVGLF